MQAYGRHSDGGAATQKSVHTSRDAVTATCRRPFSASCSCAWDADLSAASALCTASCRRFSAVEVALRTRCLHQPVTCSAVIAQTWQTATQSSQALESETLADEGYSLKHASHAAWLREAGSCCVTRSDAGTHMLAASMRASASEAAWRAARSRARAASAASWALTAREPASSASRSRAAASASACCRPSCACAASCCASDRACCSSCILHERGILACQHCTYPPYRVLVCLARGRLVEDGR